MKDQRKGQPSAAFSHCAKVAIVAGAVWAGCVVQQTVIAGPGGEQVMRGNVTFERIGNRTIIRSSDGSIIKWASFDILAHEKVKFIQSGGADSRVLNRISGSAPTVIQGKLMANGQVYLVNPAGVMFSNTAVVNVGGLYAAAGKMKNSHFIDGVNKFTNLDGPVVNDGAITGDNINLFGQLVANTGHIEAPHGLIAMVAGDAVQVKRVGDRIWLKVDGDIITDRNRPMHGSGLPDQLATPGVENTGVIKASRGEVLLGAGDMYSMAVRNSGTISAAKGNINVLASDGLIENTTTGKITTSINKGTAGKITVQGPSIVNAGHITANSNTGQGGDIEFTSQNHTFMATGSSIEAGGGTGKAKGGEILVHSYNGQTILADGSTVDVSGGADGGDGGFVEVSGDSLIFNGFADLNAKSGYEDGTLLLDPHDITIANNAANVPSFNDGVINFYDPTEIDDVTISDEALEAIQGHIILQATNNIYVLQPVVLVHNNDLTMEAYNTIHLNESITGIRNLTMTGDYDLSGSGDIFLNKPLGISGDATFNAKTTFLNSDTFAQNSGGFQHYLGPVVLCRDMNLTSPDVHFFSSVNAYNAGKEFLVVNGPAIFDGGVGVQNKLESLDVNGPSFMNGGIVKTKLHQNYNGAMTLGEDNTHISTDAGDLHYNSTVNGQHTLEAQTAGLTRFDGHVGGAGDLDSVTTDDPGATRVSGDMDAGLIDFGDPVSLGDNVTLKGTVGVIFNQTLTGEEHSAIINSPYTLFIGDVSQMNLLRTDADGITEVDGDVTGNKLDFNDPIYVLSDVNFTGHDFVDFDQTLNAVDFGDDEALAGGGGPGFNVIVNSDNLARFGGDVGNELELDSLTVNVAGPDVLNKNLIVLDGNLIRVLGDIQFNPGGRTSPAEVATVAARNFGGIKIQSVSGNIFMGLNEKLTSLGNLKLIARNGTMTLGDLNVFGNLLVDSPTINLYARGPGQILKSDGTFVDDKRASFVVFGTATSANPDVDIQLLGDGLTPIFASTILNNIQGPLGGFLTAAFAQLQQSNFTFGGTVLDLTPPLGTTPPPPPPPPSGPRPQPRPDTLTQALTDAMPQISDRVTRDPFAMRPMERLAIYVRQFKNEELSGALNGPQFANDMGNKPGSTPQERGTAVSRLRRDSVTKSMDKHTAVFVKQLTDETTGEQTPQDQTPFIRDAMAKAWKSYLDAEAQAQGGQLDPAQFRAFLATQPDQTEALAYLDGLRGLFSEMWVMGVTKLELRNALRTVLTPIVPEGMMIEQFEQALELNTLGT
jgi:filamentous hemagglutinin family protein